MLEELFARNTPLAWLAALHGVLTIILIGISLVDKHQIQGVNRWFKPIKFTTSITLYLATLGWLLGYLKEHSSAVSTITWMVVITMTIEIVIIIGQAARKQMSHFNVSTPVNGILFGIMGLAIIINTIAVGWATVLFFTGQPLGFDTGTALPDAFLWGIRLGMVMFILGSLEGFAMSAKMRHTVGEGIHDAQPGLPFVNWSRGGGDLRIAHFVALHSMQFVPLFGYFISNTDSSLLSPTGWTVVFALLYGGFCLWLFLNAMRGRPLFGKAARMKVEIE